MTAEWLNWIGGGAAVVTAGVAAWHLHGRWQMAKRKKTEERIPAEQRPLSPAELKIGEEVAKRLRLTEPKGRALFDDTHVSETPSMYIEQLEPVQPAPFVVYKTRPEPALTVGEGVAGLTVGDGPIVLEPLRDDAAAERAWAATAYTSAPVEEDPLPREEERLYPVVAAAERDVSLEREAMIDSISILEELVDLRTDGPTVEQWVAAGYQAENYPPRGWAPRIAPVRQPDTYILSRVEPNPGHIGNYPASQWSPSKAASDGGGPGTYESRAMIGGEEHSRSYVVVHPDGRVEPKS